MKGSSEYQTIPLDKLTEDPANVRKHSQKNLDAIKGSLKKFGQQKPIVVGADGVIIAGNGTYRAAKELGWKSIKCVMSKLKGVQAVAYAIADNRTGELAEWDSNLRETLRGLDSEFDLNEIGFSDEDVAAILKAESTVNPDDVDLDQAAKPNMDCVTVPAEYQDRFADAIKALWAKCGGDTYEQYCKAWLQAIQRIEK